jgi:hypothetical protein
VEAFATGCVYIAVDDDAAHKLVFVYAMVYAWDIDLTVAPGAEVDEVEEGVWATHRPGDDMVSIKLSFVLSFLPA